VFEGDTVIASARFEAAAIAGEVVLEIETDAGEVLRQSLALTAPEPEAAEDGLSTLARLAAAQRLRGHLEREEQEQGAATALRYRLMSPWTNWLAVAERSDEERAQDLPELRKVPQTLAAGWGGSGTVLRSRGGAPLAMAGAPMAAAPAMAAAPKPAAPGTMSRIGSALRKMAAPLLHEDSAAGKERAADGFTEAQAVENAPDLLELLRADPARLRADQAWSLLLESGLGAHFNDLFREAAAEGVNIEVLAAIALAEIVEARLAAAPADALQAPLAGLRAYAREMARTMLKLSARTAMQTNAMGSPAAEQLFGHGKLDELRQGAPLPDMRALLERTRTVARGQAQASAVA
jgi:hypothetical protein